MRDLHTVTTAALMMSGSFDSEEVSDEVSLFGYNAAELVLVVGVGGAAFDSSDYIEFVLEHSMTDNDDYDPVEDIHMLGVSGIEDGIIKTIDEAHAAAAVYRFGYIGDRNYLRLTADFTGTHGDETPISAVVMLGKPSHAPTADQP